MVCIKYILSKGIDMTEYLQTRKEFEEMENKIQKQPQKTEPVNSGQIQGSKKADELLRHILYSGVEFFVDQFGDPHAVMPLNGHNEIWSVKSKNFRRWVTNTGFEAEGSIPSSESIKAVIDLAEAKACFGGQNIELNNRVALHDNCIYYDMTDREWRSVRIGKDGWDIINPTILFRRYSHQAAQVTPMKEGDIKRVLKYTNFKSEDDEILFLVTVVSNLIPNIPHIIPNFHGSQGSGKSTHFCMVKRICDPSKMLILDLPDEKKELIQKLSHHWVAYFDNISHLTEWQSNILCRTVTGEGFSKRQLYTDEDDVIFSFRRCVGLNGINIAAQKPDLLDRSILIELTRIPKSKRLSEKQFWDNFNADLPVILGGTFDILSKAMCITDSIELKELPRMADFAKWGEAISRAMGYKPERFLQAYYKNINFQNDEAIEANPTGKAVLVFMAEKGEWIGTPAELYEALYSIAVLEKMDKSKLWPKAPNILTRRLNEIKTNLLEKGISIEDGDRSATKRIIIIRKTSSQSSEPSQKADTNDDDDSNDDKSGSSSNSETQSALKTTETTEIDCISIKSLLPNPNNRPEGSEGDSSNSKLQKCREFAGKEEVHKDFLIDLGATVQEIEKWFRDGVLQETKRDYYKFL